MIISSGTDEVRAKREPSLCNESVKRHFWSKLAKNCLSASETRRGSSEARTEYTRGPSLQTFLKLLSLLFLAKYCLTWFACIEFSFLEPFSSLFLANYCLTRFACIEFSFLEPFSSLFLANHCLTRFACIEFSFLKPFSLFFFGQLLSLSDLPPLNKSSYSPSLLHFVPQFFFIFLTFLLSFMTRLLFCSTRISKVGKCVAFQFWTPTYFFSKVRQQRNVMEKSIPKFNYYVHNKAIWTFPRKQLSREEVYRDMVIPNQIYLLCTQRISADSRSIFWIRIFIAMGLSNYNFAYLKPLNRHCNPNQSLTRYLHKRSRMRALIAI